MGYILLQAQLAYKTHPISSNYGCYELYIYNVCVLIHDNYMMILCIYIYRKTEKKRDRESEGERQKKRQTNIQIDNTRQIGKYYIMIYPPLQPNSYPSPIPYSGRMMTSASLPSITERMASACPGRSSFMDQSCPRWMENAAIPDGRSRCSARSQQKCISISTSLSIYLSIYLPIFLQHLSIYSTYLSTVLVYLFI